jgi:hypothetical protein
LVKNQNAQKQELSLGNLKLQSLFPLIMVIKSGYKLERQKDRNLTLRLYGIGYIALGKATLNYYDKKRQLL